MRIIGLLLVFCISWAHAQLVVRIDKSLTRNIDKSLSAAVVLSTAIPGLGEYYLGEPQKLKPHLWMEMLGWSAVAASYFTQQSYLHSAQAYAERYAGAQGIPADADFLDLVSRYRSRAGVSGEALSPAPEEDYNLSLLRYGRAIDEEYAFDAAHSWDWGSSENPANTLHMQNYAAILRNYRMARISLQVAFGVVVLNRLVSALQVVRIYRETSAKDLALIPLWSPHSAGGTLMYNF